jgi:predicted amidohydrolase
MYITTAIYEKRGVVVYNTAPLYDRQGNLVHTYEKNELFEPELESGASPGIGYKVFETDFAKLGFMTCYDSWFPETARLLAYKGST